MENRKNKTYDFIGKLALILFSQGIKMSYTTLIELLAVNGYRRYGNERGMAAALKAACEYWDRKEQDDCKISTTHGAIANTFVGKAGYPSWLDY